MSTVKILVNGKPVKQHYHNGNTYVEGRNGTEYAIQIKNSNLTRKLAVITVDGINVLTGEPQGEEKGRGYIIEGYGTLDVKGFRPNNDMVGAFRFSTKGESYCKSQGLEGNNGVIGVRLYDEIVTIQNVTVNQWVQESKPYPKYPEPKFYYYDTTCANNIYRDIDTPFNCSITSTPSSQNLMRSVNLSSSSPTPKHGLGTKWGSQIEDKVTEVHFLSYDYHSEEFVIYYDTRNNLKEIGISFDNSPKVAKHSRPQAFGNYARPPQGWPRQ